MGSGGQASVWLCRDLLVGREVAVKVVDFEGDPDRARRAEREIRALQRLTDPHTVRVLDTGRDNGDHYVYIVMPVVTGESLADRLRRGRMGAADVVSIIRGVSSSLGEAHAQGVCHRDVKPGNIMIHTSGAAVLLDFGIASSLDQTSSLTATGTVVGTPTYMAPEVICGEKATPASDVYFLGAVMYECACGRPPFKADTMHALLMAITHGNYPPPSCATELRGLIVQMLDLDPGQRPTAQDLLVRLAAIRTSITSQATEHAGTRTARIAGSTRARAEQPTSATWRLTTPATRPHTDGAPHDLTVTAPIKGRSVPLSEVADPTFSQGLLGPGMAIVPDSGPVVSPVDGEVLVAFPTGHAYGLRSASGVELLIHVGMDTVKLDGKGFTPHVKAGDKVRRGTPLVDVDWAAIKAAGYETVTPVVVSNAAVFDVIRGTSSTEVVPGSLFSGRLGAFPGSNIMMVRSHEVQWVLK